eukprot:2314828-Amphidinium_carterae.1
MLLADMGFTEKAQRYLNLLQYFVKAVPQKQLSDAFRSGMRDFKDTLCPAERPASDVSLTAEAPQVGRMVQNLWGSSKGLFRGIAETTGLKVKATPAPALQGEEDESVPLGPRPPPPVPLGTPLAQTQ